jgi:hypothetical protein
MRVEGLREALAVGRYAFNSLQISNELGYRLFLEESGKLPDDRLVLLDGLGLPLGKCDALLEHVGVELVLRGLLQVALKFSEASEVVLGTFGGDVLGGRVLLFFLLLLRLGEL